MTHTLILLRHGKSDYPVGVPDIERPLADRGRREAALAGAWLAEHCPPVDLVLCSTATRTRQTLECTGVDAPVRFLAALYQSRAADYRTLIATTPEDVGTLLVIGHEPRISRTAVELADPHSALTAQLAVKYPTSAVAVLSSALGWAELELQPAEILAFHVPR